MIQLREPLMTTSPVQLQLPVTGEASWLEIDLAAVERNAQALRDLARQDPARAAAGRPLFCAVIKKNAYGLGAGPIAHRLVKAGCDMLGVYSPAEAEDLVKHAVVCPILLLMPLRRLHRTDVLYRYAVADRLHLTIHDVQQVQQVNRIGQTFGIRLPVHLLLDTGMSRSGMNLGQLREVLENLHQTKHIRVAGIWSHLATADDNPTFAGEQLGYFLSCMEELADVMPPDVVRHIANTFGTLRDPAFHLDMVRPGLGLFGFGPDILSAGPVISDAPTLAPIVRWVSKLVHVQQYPAGAPVGYGATHILDRDSVLGVVPVGYGDGYPLALSGKATMRVQSVDDPGMLIDAPVVGRVNMDQVVIDLTDAVSQGDPDTWADALVEVISNDPAAPNALPRLAELAGVHCYEILCRLGAHLPRKYLR